jgi:transcriptional regulator GlxA family with amidase domain
LREVCAWASNHLDADLSVESLAARAHLSARQFTRRFREAFDTTPARYMRALRLDAARTALSQPGSHIARVARHCGFEDVEVFRRAFERQYRTSPREYRRRFAAREAEA